MKNEKPRILEFFAGIGGAAEAFGALGQVVAAIDINQNARQVYRSVFPHPYLVKSIESLTLDDLLKWQADVWWISAPCQPFTRRGKQRDDVDPRSLALKRLCELIPLATKQSQPKIVFFENVAGFDGSQMHGLFLNALKQSHFSTYQYTTCPTRFGIPNQRPRLYLAASRSPSAPWLIPDAQTQTPTPTPTPTLASYLDSTEQASLNQGLWLTAEHSNMQSRLNIVHREDRYSTCFTSAYGKSSMLSGSYLREVNGRIRRFSPAEIARLLGFSEGFVKRFRPETTELTQRQLWKLVGNSISITVVKALIRHHMEELN